VVINFPIEKLITTYDTPPLVAELKGKKTQNLLVFGATLPGCRTFCTETLCTKSATAIKTAGYHYRKTGRFYGGLTTFLRPIIGVLL
jgi:hypothetical protein